jgi:Tol biopolymer transport system component
MSSPTAATAPGLPGRLAYIAGGDVFILHAGTAPQRLTTSGDVAAVRWSPGGGYLLALQDGQVVVLGLDGSVRPGLAGAWLPDDSGVAVPTPGGGVAVVSPATGTAAPLLSDDPGRAFLPVSWSPDGKSLALTRQDLNAKAFPIAQSTWLVDRDGGNLRQLLPAGDTWPVPLGWSPDGRSLTVLEGPSQVCVSCRVDGQQLDVVSADGYHVSPLGVLVHNDWLSWAPDASGLAVAVGEGRETYRNKQVIWFRTADGAIVPLAVESGQVSIEPAVSPDGRTVALVRGPELPGPAFANLDDAHGYPGDLLGARRVWLAPADGGASRQLTPGLDAAEEGPTWVGPASSGLLLTVRWRRGGDGAPAAALWLTDARSGAAVQLVPSLQAPANDAGYYGDLGWQKVFSWHP